MMAIRKSVNATACAILCFLSSSNAFIRSRYATSVENYLRTHNGDTFAKQWLEAGDRDFDYREDVPLLIGVLSKTDDTMLQEHARTMLFVYAFGALTNPSIGDLFRPAVPIFERHLQEALADESGSSWGQDIVALTAFAGLQPSPQALDLIYRMTSC